MKCLMKMKRAISAISLAVIGTLFILSAFAYPGGGYNPFMRMLSALGRSEVRLVEHPWSQYLFMGGMFLSALAVLVHARWSALSCAGAWVNAAGLVLIALFPEDVHRHFHDAACWLAAVGGGLLWLSWFRRENSRPRRLIWSAALMMPLVAFGLGLVFHAIGLAPFAPWVPTAQKLLIVAFAVWLAAGVSSDRSWRLQVGGWAVGFLFLCFISHLIFNHSLGQYAPRKLCFEGDIDNSLHQPLNPLPLGGDELAGLTWLEHVTGPLDAEGEKFWWNHGQKQFSIFSMRYHIAFSGYAAAAIGLRGDAEVRRRVGRILGNCVKRMLERETWGYSQARSYWGEKPWAPDPCYRENVMYTGHLLQLLAYYELFTGDRRYHRAGGGWDFVWKDGRKVHYDVEKLIDVTVEQMRKGPNGGITCEPGLMFFACNNHPNVALSVFRHLGYGDWTKDAAHWEKWALSHYFSPAFGGGALKLVYHVRSNLLYPRGQSALDGWSLLWYEPWASDRRMPKALWNAAAAHIDWSRVEAADDIRGGRDCCDPEPVPPSVTAVFLAAAARACDDVETAARLERAVDARYLSRTNGWYFLNLSREGRVGASAVRILSLAESRGSRLRQLPSLAP